jgi:hypothetical protein
MIDVYVDQNGRAPESSTFVAAGFIAQEETWRAFTAHWERELGREPMLAYVRVYESHWLGGQFFGWSQRERNVRLESFLALIRSHVLGWFNNGNVTAPPAWCVSGRYRSRRLQRRKDSSRQRRSPDNLPP